MRYTTAGTVSILLAASFCAGQSEPPWTQLSLSTCGVDTYRQTNPQIDGRGVVVAVLDTGVDMGVAGLGKTTTGEVKVVDVQDFSGQGDVDIARAVWNETKDKIARQGADGAPELYTPPPAEQRSEGTTVWFGVVKEESFKNSSVPDVNDNGRRDDVFGICVISVDAGADDDAVCYVDTNGDRDFSDERPLKNYKLAYDAFTFAREQKEKQIIPLTCGLNIFVRQRKVVLHYDDGGHGTHVAGIATGHRIQNQDGFDGVAPGAKVISMKIGENRLAGGATTTGSMKKAFEYAARYAREHNVTVVCNLSFGIGSKDEEESDIDQFVDQLLRENPYLIICTSAGNEGPGLSTIGTPAAAAAAISVGAVLAADTARDMYGVQISEPQIIDFSSRGGELDKPDVVTPGQTTSTVPRWNRGGDFWGGTSMASPYAAGLCAILAQHCREKAGVAVRADWVKAALRRTAEPLSGYTMLDYGSGRPVLGKAAAMIETLATKGRDDPLYAFQISTECPTVADASAPAAYWRGAYFPIDIPQAFTIKPIFVPQVDAAVITAFSKRLTLRSTADWCKVLQDQIYFRDTQSATVRVSYDAAKLKEPGLYVTAVEGLDGDRPALRLVNTVVVPHRVSAETDYKVKLDDQTVEGWKVRRHFFAVPTGASAMHITMRAAEGQLCTARVRHVHGPDGRQAGGYPLRLDSRNNRLEATFTISKELEPGIWEIPITSTKADETSAYSLEVRFAGVHAEPTMICDLAGSPGSPASGSAKLINLFDRPLPVETSGRIEGYRKTETKKLTADEDTVSIPIEFTSAVRAVRVEVKVSDEDYEKFTDASVNVYDASGAAIAQEGMDEPILTLTADNPDPDAESASCKLEVRPAFAQTNVEISAQFKIKIDYLYKDPIDISVKRGDGPQFTLYPSIPAAVSYSLAATPPKAPDGTRTIGYIRTVERPTQQVVAEIELLGKK